MWSLQTNKYFAGFLLAIWLVWIANYAGNVIIPIPEAPEDTGEAVAAAAPAETKPKEPEKPLPVLLAEADPAKGERVAKKCQSCHSLEKGGPNKVGPDLYNLFDRVRGTHEGYAYSDAMKKLGGKWDFEQLNHFLTKPRDFLPGTKMSFTGLKKATDRADILRYLATLNDEPPALPKP